MAFDWDAIGKFGIDDEKKKKKTGGFNWDAIESSVFKEEEKPKVEEPKVEKKGFKFSDLWEQPTREDLISQGKFAEADSPMVLSQQRADQSMLDKAKAEKNEKKLAKEEMNRLEKQIKDLTIKYGTSPTKEQVAEIKSLSDKFMTAQGKARAGRVGFMEGMTFGLSKPILQAGEKVTDMPVSKAFAEAEKRPEYGTGKVAGALVGQSALYSAISPILQGTRVGKALLGGEGASLARKFAGAQAADFAADVIIQSPIEAIQAINEDKTLDEFMKDYATNRAFDVLMNGIVGGVVTGKQALDALKASNAEQALKQSGLSIQEVEQAITSGNVAPIQQKLKEIDYDKIAKANQEKTKKEIEAFQAWQKQNTGGAFGKPDADTIELYKMYTGKDMNKIAEDFAKWGDADNVKKMLEEKERFKEIVGLKETQVESPKEAPTELPKIKQNGVQKTISEQVDTIAPKEQIKTDSSQFETQRPVGVDAPEVGAEKVSKLYDRLETSPSIENPIRERILKEPGKYNPTTNEEQLKLGRQLIEEDFEGVVNLIRSGNKFTGDVESAIVPEVVERLQKEGRHEDAWQLLESASEKYRSAGRQVQTASLFRKTTPEGMTNYLKKAVDKANESLPASKKIELTEQEVKNIYDEMKIVQEMDTPAMQNRLKEAGLSEKQIKNLSSDKIKDFNIALTMSTVSNKMPTSVAQKISTLQAMSHLLNAKTMSRNVLGNLAFASAEKLSNYIATPIDRLISLKTGKKTVFTPNWVESFKQSAKRTGEAAAEVKLGVEATGKYDLFRGQTFKKGTLSKLEKALAYGLKVPDESFKGFMEADALYQQVKGRLGDSVDKMSYKEIVKKATTKELDRAAYEARFATFQDDSLIAQTFQGIKDVANKIGVGRTVRGGSGLMTKEFGLGDLIIKYTRVPGNIIQRGLEYSPLGAVKALNLLYEGSKKGLNQRELSLTLGRALTGTGAIALGSWLYDKGLLSSEEKGASRGMTAIERAEGLGNYKVNITALKRMLAGGDPTPKSGDEMYSYNWAQPVSIPFAVGAAVAQERKKDQTPTDYAKNITARSMEEMVDIPTLMIINKMFYEGMKEDSNMLTVASVPVKEALPGFIPSPVRQLAQTLDPTAREAKTTEERIRSNIPIIREGLEPKISPTGEEIKYDTRLSDLLNPSQRSVYKPKEITADLKALEKITGSTDHVPAYLKPKTIVYRKQSYDLTPAEQTEYAKVRGEIINEYYIKALKDVDVNDLTQAQSETLVKRLADIKRKANDEARKQILREKLK